ncbi:MAG: LamG-like jellyroll fold domain-containing protein, partial [Friedmanniella sp.]
MGVLYLTNTGALVFGINNAAKATITASGTYRDGQWHHVMATVGPGGMRLYVDGAQAATSSTTATGS